MTHLISLKGNAQDDLDLGTWYIMKVAESDKSALQHRIQTVVVSVRDSTGEKIVTRKIYDKNGYLVYRVDYSNNKPDSIETVIKRIPLNETIVKYKIIKGQYDAEDEDCPVNYLGAYWDTLSADKYSILTKTYKRLPGKIIRVVTSFNGVIKGSSDFPLPDTGKHRIKYPRGDTTHIHDTLVVRIRKKDDPDVLLVMNRYFIKGLADPVKTESLKYVNDSLVYHGVELDEYDKKKRLINHSVYQGPPLKQYESKRIIYDDVTGEWTQLNDNYPTSGTPQLIWRYDKKGRILYYERVGVFGRDKGSAVCKYNEKGVLIEEIFSVNDVPTTYTLYKYRYY